MIRRDDLEMDKYQKKRCIVSSSNKFWLYYLSLERALIDISDYLSISQDNYKSYSFKIMQLFFSVCSEVDSIFKYIHFNLYKQKLIFKYVEPLHDIRHAVIMNDSNLNTNRGLYNQIKSVNNFSNTKITQNIKMLNDTFPLIRQTVITTNFNGDALEFKPFEVLFYSYEYHNVKKGQRRKVSQNIEKKYHKEGSWWEQYNSLKHQRLDSYHLANLENLLNALSALHILNLLYVLTLNKDSDYLTYFVEAPTVDHYPILQVQNSCNLRYTGCDMYGANLYNKSFYTES